MEHRHKIHRSRIIQQNLTNDSAKGEFYASAPTHFVRRKFEIF